MLHDTMFSWETQTYRWNSAVGFAFSEKLKKDNDFGTLSLLSSWLASSSLYCSITNEEGIERDP